MCQTPVRGLKRTHPTRRLVAPTALPRGLLTLKKPVQAGIRALTLQMRKWRLREAGCHAQGPAAPPGPEHTLQGSDSRSGSSLPRVWGLWGFTPLCPPPEADPWGPSPSQHLGAAALCACPSPDPPTPPSRGMATPGGSLLSGRGLCVRGLPGTYVLLLQMHGGERWERHPAKRPAKHICLSFFTHPPRTSLPRTCPLRTPLPGTRPS